MEHQARRTRSSGSRSTKQARYIEQALYLLWRQGAKVVINLQIRDPAQGAVAGLCGPLLQRRHAEAVADRIRFPFVTDRASSHAVRAWGKAPVAAA